MSTAMRAMVLKQSGEPLRAVTRPRPVPHAHDLLIRVHACAVCRTDLHIIDGDLAHPKPDLIPGHEIIGEVIETGPETGRFGIGARVGVPWLGRTCGTCRYCRTGRENLCDRARFTGYDLDGGFAEYARVHEDYAFAIPEVYSDRDAAPLMCAGLIGYRSLAVAGDARRLGLYGFGAAAHIIAQVAVHQGRELFAFTREGDTAGQTFARDLGAVWAGASTQRPPDELDAAIIFAPVGALVPMALEAVGKGGAVVCAGIHMSDIPAFAYELLWGERVLRSVANLTRADGEAFLDIAPRVPVHTTTHAYALEEANRAIDDLRFGRITGAAVLVNAKTSPA